MQKQVITILPDGGVSGLQVKKGKGVDLRTLGDKAYIERVSVIQWNADVQQWYVDVLQEQGRGPLTVRKWQDAFDGGRDLQAGHQKLTEIGGSGVRVYPLTGGVLFFDEYDEAVSAEIEYLNMLRVQGQF